jgi:hypothetical protein
MMSKARIMCALGLMLFVGAPCVYAANACSNGSVAGKWALSSNGTLLTAGGQVPVAAVANFSINDSGTLSGRQTRSLGGQVADETFTGSINVNADCSAESTVKVFMDAILVRTTNLHIVFDDNASSARGIFTSIILPNDTALSNVITLEARKLFPKDYATQALTPEKKL